MPEKLQDICVSYFRSFGPVCFIGYLIMLTANVMKYDRSKDYNIYYQQ